MLYIMYHRLSDYIYNDKTTEKYVNIKRNYSVKFFRRLFKYEYPLKITFEMIKICLITIPLFL